MTAELDIFLAHYGVKGMRWGVRKRATDVSSSKKSKKPLTDEQKRFRRDVASTVVLGTTYLAIAAAPKVATALQSAAGRKKAADGARKAAEMLSDSRGITNYRTVELAFDSVRKSWG